MKKRLKTLPLLLTIIMAAMAPINTSMATCIDAIKASRYPLGEPTVNDDPGMAALAVVMGQWLIRVEGTVMGLGGGLVAGGLITSGTITTTAYNEAENKLKSNQNYALDILFQAEKETPELELISFYKLVKKFIGKDKEAILPSDQIIMDVINMGNADLSLCETENGEFFRPEKSDLLKAVIENLN